MNIEHEQKKEKWFSVISNEKEIEIHLKDDPDIIIIRNDGEVILMRKVYATGAFLSHTLCRKGLIPI